MGGGAYLSQVIRGQMPLMLRKFYRELSLKVSIFITIFNIFWAITTYPASSGFSRPDATLRRERNHFEHPSAFPSRMRVHVMTTNIQRQDGNENFNKTIGLISKATTLHAHHAFIFAFLCHFCTTTTWRCLILRFMDNVNKQRRNLFFFRSWTWIWSLGIQILLGSPTFDKVSK